MKRPLRLTRRALLAASASVFAPPPLRAESGSGPGLVHGLSSFGDLKYPADFAHVDYVDPAAPRGGVLSLTPSSWVNNQNPQNFNSFNSFIVQGDAAVGSELLFDALCARAFDEPDAVYGLIAKAMAREPGRVRFLLREEARFHDGAPIAAEDVAFSILTLRDKGHPYYRQALAGVAGVRTPAPREVVVDLAADASRDLPLIVATLPVFQAAWFATRPFDVASLETPVGSGPYTVARHEPGRFVEYRRIPDHWADALPIRRGAYNFDRIRYELFRDRAAALLAFKAREYEFREEFTSRSWATEYEMPEIASGAVRREEVPDATISGGQGWYLNLRRPKLADIRVREALQIAFDFEWSDANLFFGLYDRSHSIFEGARFMAQGLPSPDELALLEPFLGQIPDEAFGEAVRMPVSDGSGGDRALLRRAADLFAAAGFRREGGRLLQPDGAPFTFEILDDDPGFGRVVEPYLQNLRRLGVDATSRIVDGAQYAERVKRFDFDATPLRITIPQTPGVEIGNNFGSASAALEGSRNLSGLASPAIDALIARIGAATSRAELDVALRALDRVLRAMRFMVPHWSKASHWMAWWDVFDRPETKPSFDRGVVLTWWRKPA
jgi:microcin C transport system substrate-binding protein